MKISVLVATFICFSSLSCKKDDAVGNNVDAEINHSMPMENELMSSMESSNTAMAKYKLSGDFDYDFANIMLTHHQMAIEMSKVLVKKGKDTTIKNMANGIVDVQNTEVGELQFFIQNHKIVAVKKDAVENLALQSNMTSMMDKMNSVPMTDSIDKDYVAMMIPHHESAVEMAKSQIIYGKNAGLKALAKTIIKNQNIEIDAFKSWQTKQ